eukprot:scaffold37472_cov24-Phaeocystis_antarctica.AAC.1
MRYLALCSALISTDSSASCACLATEATLGRIAGGLGGGGGGGDRGAGGGGGDGASHGGGGGG